MNRGGVLFGLDSDTGGVVWQKDFLEGDRDPDNRVITAGDCLVVVTEQEVFVSRADDPQQGR